MINVGLFLTQLFNIFGLTLETGIILRIFELVFVSTSFIIGIFYYTYKNYKKK